MNEKIVKIQENRDNNHGEDIVNSLLAKGWSFISACQVGTAEAMDIVYVVGATQEVLDKESRKIAESPSKFQQFIENSK